MSSTILRGLSLHRAGVSLGSVRWFTAQTKVVDEMISYARLQCKGNPEQARDVLRQGLGSDEAVGADAGRLLLALADVEHEDSNWPRIVELAQAASKAAQAVEPGSTEGGVLAAEVQMEAGWVETRARLTLGEDAAAATVAKQGVEAARDLFFQSGAEERRWQALTLANSNVATLQHAISDLRAADATASAVMALTQHSDKRDGTDTDRDRFIPAALKQVGALRAAQGQVDQATTLYNAAAAAAAANLVNSKGDSCVLHSPMHMGDIVADSLLGRAQLLHDGGDQEEAEAVLSEALSAAEAIGGDAHPRVALVLAELAGVYARTARVSYAEGLYREATKQLRLDGEPDPSAARSMPMHPSVAAVLAWRYSQLLSALPKRTTEADQWAARGRAYYEGAAGLNTQPIEATLGQLDTLKQGGGDPGRGCLLNLTLRRVLPMAPQK